MERVEFVGRFYPNIPFKAKAEGVFCEHIFIALTGQEGGWIFFGRKYATLQDIAAQFAKNPMHERALEYDAECAAKAKKD